ncbi:MAG: hypothetical protein MUE97_00330 [Phycisphaerales bacterium]|jgi:hypothetical protein|nr:hypothetical protein [Phycisphaerales bacterium]
MTQVASNPVEATAAVPEQGAGDAARLARPPLFDAGWLLLIPGIVIIALMVLLPAAEDRNRARFYRDRAQLVEQHSQARLVNHAEYLAALKRGDEAVLRAQAAVQLNKVPRGEHLLMPDGAVRAGNAAPTTKVDIRTLEANVYDRLEPPTLTLSEYHREYSTLEQLAMGERSRLWMIGLGAFLIFAGLLPAARR